MSVISYVYVGRVNVRGLASAWKQESFLNYIRSRDLDVIFACEPLPLMSTLVALVCGGFEAMLRKFAGIPMEPGCGKSVSAFANITINVIEMDYLQRVGKAIRTCVTMAGAKINRRVNFIEAFHLKR